MRTVRGYLNYKAFATCIARIKWDNRNESADEVLYTCEELLASTLIPPHPTYELLKLIS